MTPNDNLFNQSIFVYMLSSSAPTTVAKCGLVDISKSRICLTCLYTLDVLTHIGYFCRIVSASNVLQDSRRE
ncbi:hypothetical protein TB9_13930 [Xanthomonas perforans]|uniref:Uncharacterized protein n=1 Tax=Xanthomonas perforans TaxID=442694 RepID=A0AAQ0YMR8_XANPE|nr:hypothetical protein BJD13_13980 [Xanthomonas perforans]AQS76517.1 hypothetical protein XPE_09645 [Xanthomonas perforans 91-118]PPT62915.1 hypothetical protein XarbCFBP8130_13560 [Xanthomonas arboricola]KLC03292.1 hypothetical protein XP420_18015 [Xanthomonas perforans]KLC03716.1 hypothetical protein XP315_15775 [Xanthomonas perforans]